MTGPIGRDAEREVAATFVAAAASGFAVLQIEGDAGIGKTTLLRFTADSALAAGGRVVSCGLTEAESTLSFAGLTDLMRGVSFDHLEDLPGPQRHALAVATLREAPADAAIDGRTIGTALVNVLSTMAEEGPLIVAIDDAHWLDRASADVLTFAMRRMHGQRCGVVTCRRPGMADLGFTAHLGSPSWERTLAMRGLSAAALFHIVRDQQGVTLRRPTLLRITEAARGNPFLTLELSRANTAGNDGSDAVSLTESLQLLVWKRLSALSDEARGALLAVACAVRPTPAMIAGLGHRAGLEEAEVAQVISVDHGRVVFDHPLLSAAVVQAATAPALRATHRQLGDVCTDVEGRARHFALANPDPDPETSAALDQAVLAAEARGATVIAAELARLALDRTVASDVVAEWERRLRLARLLHAAGSAVTAGETLADVERRCPPGQLRAEVQLVMTEVAYQTATTERALVHARAALDDAGADLNLRARALLSMAVLSTDGREKSEYAAEASRCLAKAGEVDPSLLAWAALEMLSARFHLGQGLDLDALEEALAAERSGRVWRSADQVAAVRPVLLKWADQNEAALAALDELRDRAQVEGNEGLLPYIAGHIPGILLRTGRFEDAATASALHLELALATGQDGQRMQALYNSSLVDAHRGNLQLATATGHEMLTWSTANGDRWVEMSACAVLGFSAFSGGDLQAARSWLDRWWDISEAEGLVDPGITRFHGDHIEALIGLGAVTEAAASTARLEQRAAKAARVSASAVAARCRALLLATSGNHQDALSAVDAALALHELCPNAFDLARTLLTQGVIHRRAKEKAAAKQSLGRAHAMFVDLGARAFSDRTALELARIGTRVTLASELTASERRIAELAASGLTNRQVAERSFMSPKTVEANLARVYRKLGISSRAELGARMTHPP